MLNIFTIRSGPRIENEPIPAAGFAALIGISLVLTAGRLFLRSRKINHGCG